MLHHGPSGIDIVRGLAAAEKMVGLPSHEVL